jgi:hypothetical protein
MKKLTDYFDKAHCVNLNRRPDRWKKTTKEFERLCGKGGWIYDVDKQGNILSKSFNEIPADIEKFRTDNVVKEIINKYKEIIE